MDELNVNVTANSDTVFIRTGEAPPVVQPKKIVIVGNITAITAWLALKEHDKKNAFVTVLLEPPTGSKNLAAELKFYDSASNPLATKIKAELLFSPVLAQIGINDLGKQYGKDNFLTFLKMSRVLFPDREKHGILLSQVKNFSAEVKRKIEDKAVEHGNKNSSFSQSVKTDILQEIVFEIPVFKGEVPRRFNVEICYDVTDGGIRFWLESPDLLEIIDKEKKEIIERELTVIAEKQITIINI